MVKNLLYFFVGVLAGFGILLSGTEDSRDFKDKIMAIHPAGDFLSQVDVGNVSVVFICQEGQLTVAAGDRLLHTSIQHLNTRFSCR